MVEGASALLNKEEAKQILGTLFYKRGMVRVKLKFHHLDFCARRSG